MNKIKVYVVIKYLCLKFFTTELVRVDQDLIATLGFLAFSYSTVAYWCTVFKRGSTAINDHPRTERPASVVTTQMIKKVENIVLTDPHDTIYFVAEEMKKSIGGVYKSINKHLDVKNGQRAECTECILKRRNK